MIPEPDEWVQPLAGTVQSAAGNRQRTAFERRIHGSPKAGRKLVKPRNAAFATTPDYGTARRCHFLVARLGSYSGSALILLKFPSLAQGCAL
jgi:hypothetical protein